MPDYCDPFGMFCLNICDESIFIIWKSSYPFNGSLIGFYRFLQDDYFGVILTVRAPNHLPMWNVRELAGFTKTFDW